MDRRCHLKQLAGMLTGLALPWPAGALAKGSSVIRVNLPGPRSLPFLPLELIGPLGIDRELGVALTLRYFTSGVLAFEDMMAGNAPFAGHGFAILPGMRKKGKPALAIASIAGSAAALAILVRADLAGKIKTIADLKFRSIGVSSGSVNSKTYLQLVGEQVLSDHGVASSEVRWVQTAQNWDSIRSVLASKSADAVFCEEPFSSRAVSAGLARFLFSAGDMKKSQSNIGGNHLRAVLSRNPSLTGQSDETRLLVQMLQRSLQWLARAKPANVVSSLNLADSAEGKELASVLGRHAGIFSPDGRFSAETLSGTAILLKKLGAIEHAADLNAMIEPQWLEGST